MPHFPFGSENRDGALSGISAEKQVLEPDVFDVEVDLEEDSSIKEVDTINDLFLLLDEQANSQKEQLTEEMKLRIDQDLEKKKSKLRKCWREREKTGASKWSELEKCGLYGRYVVLKMINEGGMGVVKLAWDMNLMKFVAIKTIRSELASTCKALQRFKREMHLLSFLSDNEFITHIYDVVDLTDPGAVDGKKLGLVMEYIEDGEDLFSYSLYHRSELRDLDVEDFDYILSGIIIQICLALEQMHENGIVYRDFKPENIMLQKKSTRTGSEKVPAIKLLDFGISGFLPIKRFFLNVGRNDKKLREYVLDWNEKTKPFGRKFKQGFVDDNGLGKIDSSNVFGTMPFISPEGVMQGEMTVASDIFSFGVTLFKLIMREFPYGDPTVFEPFSTKIDWESTMEKMSQNLKIKPEELRIFRNGRKKGALDDLIMQTIEAEPKNRPQSARQFAELAAGAMLVAYPSAKKELGVLIGKLGKKPEELESLYKSWEKERQEAGEK